MIETIVAGDTLDFTVSVADYPASAGWTLKYRLTPRFATPVQAPVTLSATTNANGADYNVQAAPATTAAWAAGIYAWARWVEKTGARQTLDESGLLIVKADPSATAQGFDARGHARKVLDAIEAVIEGRATKDQEEYTIGNRRLIRTPLPELIKLRQLYRGEVASEEAAGNLIAGTALAAKLQVRF